MPKFRTVEKSDDVKTARRVFAIGAAFAISFGILASRAVYFHLKDNEELEKVALRQYRTAVKRSTKRGRILDASGRELAIDITVESAFANPLEVDDPAAMADKLSTILKTDRSNLYDRLTSGRKFAWIKRRLSEEEAKSIRGLALKGIYFMRESKRSYPSGTLAAPILGAVGLDSEPLGGIELAYNGLLSAQGGGAETSDIKRDARGHLYLSTMNGNDTNDTGGDRIGDVHLTIDRTLQFIAERELARTVERARAKAGSVIVLDVNSGAVLAMANLPTFDPNSYENFEFSNWKNRAISDVYEPGSTFKTVIIAAALDSGSATAEEIFDCEGGSIHIGDKVVHDAHPHRKLSLADIVKVSSNIGAYKVEQRLGPKRSYTAIRDFGFGRVSGIDLPGESAGLLSPYGDWSPLQFATIAFGQGIAATPLQMVTAFAAIANGGTLYRPYAVARVTGDGGRDLYVGTPEALGRSISEPTARLMTKLLVRVAEPGGTGKLAASLEYKVAGKTGTAQKANLRTSGYAAGKYYASFVGFAPADQPRIAVYVGIDEPGGGMYYGGQIAAPAFRKIVEETLHYLKVPGQVVTASEDVGKQLPPKAETAELVWVETPGNDLRHIVQDGDQSWKLPDFYGLSIRDVLWVAGSADITWRLRGSGVAVRQSPQAGSVVPAGTEVQVEFMPLM